MLAVSKLDRDDIPMPVPAPIKPKLVDQRVLETCWMEAMRAVRDGMTSLRAVFPDRTQGLPETGERALRSGLHGLEDVLADLHRAGRHVLGEDAYAQYLDDLDARTPTRGDLDE